MTVKISIMKRFKFLKISEIGVAFDRKWLIIGDVSQDFVNLRTFHVNGWNDFSFKSRDRSHIIEKDFKFKLKSESESNIFIWFLKRIFKILIF